MHRSEQRILTTHVGSLPRPRPLTDLLIRQERGEAIDQAEFERQVEAAVRMVVDKQLAAGVDVGSDGEEPRPSFATYVTQRMSGFGGKGVRPPWQDFVEFPDFAELWQARISQMGGAEILQPPKAVADVAYTDLSAAERECALFLRCTSEHSQQFTRPLYDRCLARHPCHDLVE